MEVIDLKLYISKRRKEIKRKIMWGDKSPRLLKERDHLWKILINYQKCDGSYKINVAPINFNYYKFIDKDN